MSQIGVSFTPSGGSPVYSFVFTEFSDSTFPRTYSGVASFSFTASGSPSLAGPPYAQKYIWAITTRLTISQAESFDAMYRAWDTDRSNGLAAAVGVTDETFGSTVNASAVFTTPPTYSKMGHTHIWVSFGLTEV